jgi:hypothetical protein
MSAPLLPVTGGHLFTLPLAVVGVLLTFVGWVLRHIGLHRPAEVTR